MLRKTMPDFCVCLKSWMFRRYLIHLVGKRDNKDKEIGTLFIIQYENKCKYDNNMLRVIFMNIRFCDNNYY